MDSFILEDYEKICLYEPSIKTRADELSDYGIDNRHLFELYLSF